MNENQIRERQNLKSVGKPIRKKDAIELLHGKPVFTEDIVPKDALVVKILHSPYANAIVKSVDKTAAMKIPGMVGIYTYDDVPHKRFTNAGQTYPEMSPYDMYLAEKHVRFVGDVVAIVAGETEKAVDKALKLIRVDYEVLEPVLDFRTALDNPVIVHPEDDWKANVPVGEDQMRNLVAHSEMGDGDFDAVLQDCDIVLKRTYHVKAAQQVYMETLRTYSEIDPYGRLHVISSTQIVFHCRRIIANALDIPKSKVRVEKPRIGGGFGAKQTAVIEMYPAFVSWVTKRPAMLIYTREECQTAGSPRHEMEVTVTLGASNEGKIRALGMATLSNTGAYSQHGPTTAFLTGNKSIPLYSRSTEAYRFCYDVVYTNVQPSGAYRGYGATQGLFAVETTVNELAEQLGMDPVELRMKNILREGDVMPAYDFETANACALDRCIERCSKMFDWEHKYPVRDMGNGKVRSAGIGLSMQGSCISHVDVGSATITLSDEGTYNLTVGSADMGTGSDTTLAQIAAEVLECSPDNVSTFSADTDISPYDSGSYASSTAYITGMAVNKACEGLVKNMCCIAAEMMDCSEEEVEFTGEGVRKTDGSVSVSRADIARKSQEGNVIPVTVSATHSSPVSPPPYMVGMAEIELDRETGSVTVLNYDAVVDCGTPINPNLCRIQAEGGIVQAIGMTLYENVTRNDKGVIAQNSLLQYKIPTRLDMGNLHVEFEDSYEPSGPFGIKSIGEVVMNTPAPAIAHAIYRACGHWFRTLPITPEKILLRLADE